MGLLERQGPVGARRWRGLDGRGSTVGARLCGSSAPLALPKRRLFSPTEALELRQPPVRQPGVSCLRCLSRLHQQKCGVCYFCRVSVAPRACFGDGTTQGVLPPVGATPVARLGVLQGIAEDAGGATELARVCSCTSQGSHVYVVFRGCISRNAESAIFAASVSHRALVLATVPRSSLGRGRWGRTCQTLTKRSAVRAGARVQLHQPVNKS